MPHRLTKRHLPHDHHATNDTRGPGTLPLQLASPEGTFMWGEVLPGTTALTYLWLWDAEAHAQPPGAHILLTLEGEAVIESIHNTEEEDYVTENADTAVWLHTQEHTTPPTAVPGSQPWHVIIIHLPTGTNTEEARQGWTNRWAQVCTTQRGGLQNLSLTSDILRRAPTTAECHNGTAPPTRVWTYTRTLNRGAAEAFKTTISSHQGLWHTPHDDTQKAIPRGRSTPRQTGASNHQPTNLASAQTSQQSPAPSPPWPSNFRGHPNEDLSSSKRRRHATTQHSHTSGDAPSIHPYGTSTSQPTMSGLSTS